MSPSVNSNATLYNIGNYGWVGETFYPGLGIDVGHLSFMSSGTMVGVFYGGVTGAGSSYNVSGTYTVNSNCTLTMNFSGGYTYQGVVQSSGNEVFSTTTSPTGTNLILYLNKE
jgi:hypothetical protein